MKKFIIKIFFVLITSCIFFQSCSNSDEVTDNPVGGDAFRMQVISIDLPNTTLSSDEYHATMANVDITLKKDNEHKLLFMVPSNMTLGYQDLVIHDLNNLKVTYNVKDYILTESADATISPFQTNLATFQATTSGDTTVQNAVNSYNQMYSNASAEDKIKIATLYKVNKAVFDDIILNDYSDVSGRESQDAWALVVKHKKAIIAMTAGVIITLYGPTGGEKVAGLVLIAAGYYKAVGFGQALAAQTFTTVALQVGGVLGINDRNAHAPNAPTVLLNNDVATTLPLNTNDRTFITSDSNKTETGMTTFFTFFNKLNGYVSQINPVIQWVNDHVPFVNFSLLTPETVPTSSVPVANAMDAATFQKLTLSIADPALTLQTATLTSSGQLSLKVKITGSQTTVQSTLKYNYSDKFSTFSGSFPITVSNVQTVTIGTQTWMIKNLDVTTYRNGDPIPQVSDPTQWANLTTGAWCYYENNTANGPVYGKLYNWYAVNDPRGLAPTGYHVPTDAEWSTLTNFLGGESVAGGKMKEAGTTNWQYPNTGADNSSGFTGLPGGMRTGGASFSGIYTDGNWWSSSEYGTGITNRALGRYLNYSASNTSWSNLLKTSGLSVRCIKD